MDIINAILPYVLPLVTAAVVAGLGFLIRKTHLTQELKDQLEAFTKRTIDKAKEWVNVAIAPDSDGGVKITPAEASAIRQQAWILAKEELKGPLAGMLLHLGEDWAKGIIGVALSKIGIDIGPKAPT